MSKKLEYTATNMARKFWLQEMIIGANLKYEGYADKDIRKKSVEDNIFQGRSENFRRETASGIILRLNTLDEYLINLLSNCNLEVAKQIIIYSIMKSDKLEAEPFKDWVFEEVLPCIRKHGFYSKEQARLDRILKMTNIVENENYMINGGF